MHVVICNTALLESAAEKTLVSRKHVVQDDITWGSLELVVMHNARLQCEERPCRPTNLTTIAEWPHIEILLMT